VISSIRFAGDIHPAAVFLLAAVAAVGVFWLYFRESRSVAAPYRYLLPALRAAAVAFAILILAGPIWHRRQVVGTLGRVVFAVDASESMSITDTFESDASPSRLGRALDILAGDDAGPGWLESLQDTHQVDVIAFSSGDPSLVWSSSDEEPLPSGFEMEPDGQRTDLSTGMATTLATIASQASDEVDRDPDESLSRAALVIMSDGRDNTGNAPLELAQRLESTGVAVHGFGLGSEDEPTDLGIVNVIKPTNVASDGRLAGEIVLRSLGAPDNQNATERVLRIESNGKVIWQKTVSASAGPVQKIPFDLDVAEVLSEINGENPRGVRRNSVVMDLRAAIDPPEGDTNAKNNAAPFRVSASIRDRSLLIIDGSSRWETRYLKNLFERDPAWIVDTVLYGEGTDQPIVRRGEESGEFPDTREAMAKYDAIIMGEVPPDQFREIDANLLRDFVTRGGGMILIDGHYQRLRKIAETELPELVPVNYLDEEKVAVASIRPTRIGLERPILNLLGDKGSLSELWENLPAPAATPRLEAQEGTEVWANSITQDGTKYPWLVTRMFGAGRVFYLATDQTWRWRYKVADRFHARFWNQLLAAVMQPPYSAADEFLALGTDKVEYDEGETAVIRVRIQDTQGKPVGDATVDALLMSDDQIVATVPLTVDDPARGTYRGQTAPLESGKYDVRIRASGFDSNALQANAPIWVGTPDLVELDRVSLNTGTLQQIAESGGGKYFHESSGDDILETLKPLSSGSIIESDILIWQSFYWFWAIVMLLAAEWWLRKRAGLV
jgi:uncharacterized membrane protein